MLMTEDTGIEEMEISTDANPTVTGWAPPPEIDENADVAESGYIWAVELPYFDYEYGYDGDIWTTERMFRTRKQAEVFANAWNARVELNKLLDVRNSRETSTARVKSYRVGGRDINTESVESNNDEINYK